MVSAERRFSILEASKVRSYHSTFVSGLIRAYWTSQDGMHAGSNIHLFGHSTFIASLDQNLRDRVVGRPIPVIDQDKRQLVRKSLLEVLEIVAILRKSSPSDLVVVTTVMPSALAVIELLRPAFRKRRVVFVVHSELEGTLTPQTWRSFGFYARVWIRLRKLMKSSVPVGVLDEFIRDEIVRKFPQSFANQDVYVLPHVILPFSSTAPAGQFRIGFIGYHTKHKDLDAFRRLASEQPGNAYFLIGNGYSEELTSSVKHPLPTPTDFLSAIAQCDVALLPYTGGYELSISGAANDAIAAGAHLLCTPRPAFRALAEELGPETVTICEHQDFSRVLGDRDWRDMVRRTREQRVDRVNRSRYATPAVGQTLHRMFDEI